MKVILGAGESGVGAAILAKAKGYDVFVSDMGEIKPMYRQTLDQYGIAWEEKQHTQQRILEADEVIKSPGIPDKAPIVKALKEKNISIISEIEFAGRYTNAPTVCITGSNGKTTTTSLIYHILKQGGANVGLGGNIGQSFARQVAEGNFDCFVLELSSFQLDNTYTFRPRVAVLMNITPDHLDRYEYQFQNYINSKFRITHNLTADDSFIYCADDEVIEREMKKRNITAQMLPFSIKTTDNMAAYLQNEQLCINYQNDIFTMTIQELALQGKHNVYNSMAAGIAARVMDIRKESIRRSLADFVGVEHRLEHVAKVHGILFINDSKATNINSAWYALESMNTRVVWIAGGVDKGNDYSELYELVRRKVKALVCLGKDNAKLHNAFKGIVETFDTQNMVEAVRTAYYLANDGDTVLLSPCCASFDLFQNYEDRGRQFKQAVREL